MRIQIWLQVPLWCYFATWSAHTFKYFTFKFFLRTIEYKLNVYSQISRAIFPVIEAERKKSFQKVWESNRPRVDKKTKMAMRTLYRVYDNENLDLSVSNVNLNASPRHVPVDNVRRRNANKCTECSASNNFVQLSYVNFTDYEQTSNLKKKRITFTKFLFI